MTHLLKTEPAVLIGVLTALLTAAAAFGLAVTDDQVQAVLGVLTAVLPLLGSIVTRGRVYSPATVDEALQEVSA